LLGEKNTTHEGIYYDFAERTGLDGDIQKTNASIGLVIPKTADEPLVWLLDIDQNV